MANTIADSRRKSEKNFLLPRDTVSSLSYDRFGKREMLVERNMLYLELIKKIQISFLKTKIKCSILSWSNVCYHYQNFEGHWFKDACKWVSLECKLVFWTNSYFFLRVQFKGFPGLKRLAAIMLSSRGVPSTLKMENSNRDKILPTYPFLLKERRC